MSGEITTVVVYQIAWCASEIPYDDPEYKIVQPHDHQQMWVYDQPADLSRRVVDCLSKAPKSTLIIERHLMPLAEYQALPSDEDVVTEADEDLANQACEHCGVRTDAGRFTKDEIWICEACWPELWPRNGSTS